MMQSKTASPVYTEVDERFFADVQEELSSRREENPAGKSLLEALQQAASEFSELPADDNRELYKQATLIASIAHRLATEGPENTEYVCPVQPKRVRSEPASIMPHYSHEEIEGWYVSRRGLLDEVKATRPLRVTKVHDPYGGYDGPQNIPLPEVRGGPYSSKAIATRNATRADRNGPRHLAVYVEVVDD